MKHVTDVARFVGLDLTESHLLLLTKYTNWLGTEAMRAGGIGPRELDRLERRHIADSLLFLCCFGDDVARVVDLGSGVGLPGIPLAIVQPDVEFVLVDRSGRRVDLMRRAIRTLQLANCQVVHSDIADVDETFDVVVARGSLPPDQLAKHLPVLTRRDGRAIVAGSWTARPSFAGWTTVEIPSEVLDQTVWLLMMQPA